MIRHHDRGGAVIDRFPRIVGGVHALRDDRSAPRFADPLEVFPRRRRRFERRADIGVTHRAIGEDDVGEVHQAAVAEEGIEPAGPREHLTEIGDRREIAREQLLDAVARVALAHAGDRRVDRDDQRLVAARLGATDRLQRDIAAADEIQLIPRVAGRRLFDVFHRAAGQASTAYRSCPHHRPRSRRLLRPRG